MVETRQLLRGLRRLALARTVAEMTEARSDAATLLDDAGWEFSARVVRAQLRDDRECPALDATRS